MATNRKSDERLLDKAERELVEATRHPHLAQLDNAALRDLTKLLRERRDRAQGLANRQRRDVRGKGRGTVKFEHADAGNRQKSALLAQALARVNKENSRRAEA